MPATPNPKAEQARADRAARVALLRGRSLAAALATFALALGVVASDGSMGAESTSSSSGDAATLVEQEQATGSGTTDSGTTDATESEAPLTTSQS